MSFVSALSEAMNRYRAWQGPPYTPKILATSIALSWAVVSTLVAAPLIVYHMGWWTAPGIFVVVMFEIIWGIAQLSNWRWDGRPLKHKEL